MENRRYLFITCILLVILTLGLAQTAFAGTIKTATVTTAVLNVRTGPSTSYNRIGTVTEYTVLPVLAEQNGWVQVSLADGRSAWVSGDYVEITSKNPSQKARVTTNVLNVRTGPDILRAHRHRNPGYSSGLYSSSWGMVACIAGRQKWLISGNMPK